MILVNIGLHAEAQALARSSAARADAAGSANWRSEFTTIEMMSRFPRGPPTTRRWPGSRRYARRRSE